MAGAGFDPAALGRLRAALAARVDAGRIAGAVWLLGRGDEAPQVEALGWQDATRGRPMAADTLFRLYSMTKPIVSVAALCFMERGLVSLDDPVARYLPAVGAMRVGMEGTPTARPMTVHDLLRHTAGLACEYLPPDPVRERYVQAQLGLRSRSNREVAARIAELPLLHQPGSRWEYSRATDLLGAVLETVGGAPLGEVLAQMVCGPLGMHDTAFAVDPAHAHRIAQAIDPDPDSGKPVALFDPLERPRLESAGNGLVSTVGDYGRFVRCLAAGGRLGDVRLLGRKTVAWMASDHLGPIDRDLSTLPPGYGFGLGVAVRTAPGLASDPASVGSYGWSGRAGSIFIVDPVERMVAVLMVQAPGQAAELWNLFRSGVYAAIE